jgi:thioredoxin-related protein
MKYLFILLLSIGFTAHATNTTIEFSKAGYSEIFKIAKKENKAVMLFFHFDGCPPCAKMQKETFINSEVAGFYNSHFINFEIITTTEEGKKLSEKYNVKLKPTVLLLKHKRLYLPTNHWSILKMSMPKATALLIFYMSTPIS